MYEFHSDPRKYTHDETVSELGKALTWLEQDLGLRIVNTRIQNYQNILNERETLKEPEEYKNYLLTKKEVDEFLIIYRAFESEPKENILKQIKFVISGLPYRQDSAPEKPDPARDYLHELSIAARLKLAGISVETSEDCDVVARYDHKIIYIECKRVRSKSKILPRVKDANKQIINRMGLRKSAAYGYITVDVTDLLDIGKKIEEYNSIEHFRAYSKLRLAAFSKDYGASIRSSVHKKVCAVVFYAHILGVIVSPNRQLYNVGVFYSLGAEGDSQEKMLLNMKFQPHLCS
ncbi:hypothetical protein NUT31_09260 [Aeromonas sp. BC14]|uniref:hypothetical protein n=1 Tax=Aeromonas TaxID=642 RepID=UPI001459A7BF|nr:MULTISPECIES: hypothetical protein [Aeromonas]NME01635.1 hypothetical protein [Aeromonas sp. DNRA1]UCM60383.1 hypothetical protein LEO78_14185 [Aeromonas hydrophila]WAF96614.1 hypothetical protein NUT31_09260 [Aeromonas sp. BC14]